MCGGFTTFSTFSLESFELIRSGRVSTALIYMCLSLVLGVCAVLLAEKLVG
ncbi:MAG: fluoride efflux transporter FluC [Eubacterium sp.]